MAQRDEPGNTFRISSAVLMIDTPIHAPYDRCMNRHQRTLEYALSLLREGYAYDLVTAFMDADGDYSGGLDDVHAGDLFRTLVLDERWGVAEAKEVYYAAMGALPPADDASPTGRLL